MRPVDRLRINSAGPQWVARLHALTRVVGFLIQDSLKDHFMDGRLYLLDSKPIPMGKPVRHGRVRLMSEDGAPWARIVSGGSTASSCI